MRTTLYNVIATEMHIRQRANILAMNAASDRWVKQDYCFLPSHRFRPKG